MIMKRLPWEINSWLMHIKYDTEQLLDKWKYTGNEGSSEYMRGMLLKAQYIFFLFFCLDFPPDTSGGFMFWLRRAQVFIVVNLAQKSIINRQLIRLTRAQVIKVFNLSQSYSVFCDKMNCIMWLVHRLGQVKKIV